MTVLACPSRKCFMTLPRSLPPESDGPPNPGLDAGRRRHITQPVLHERVELPAKLELVATIEANPEVFLKRFQLPASQGTVHVGEELAHRLVTAQSFGCHVLTSRLRLAHSQSSRSRIFRPRCNLDITVPTGRPSTVASSLYVNSWVYRSTKATRYSSGSASSAARTS